MSKRMDKIAKIVLEYMYFNSSWHGLHALSIVANCGRLQVSRAMIPYVRQNIVFKKKQHARDPEFKTHYCLTNYKLNRDAYESEIRKPKK